jgi:hypothetical protein
MEHTAEGADNSDLATPRAKGRPPRGGTTYRRSGGLIVLIAALAIGFAACGGPDAPSVAQVTTSSSTGRGSTAATVPKNDAAQSLVAWAACMRRHGDPNQADPTIDIHGGINITIPLDAQSLSGAVHDGTAPCNEYLAAASAALRAGTPNLQPPDQAALVRFSQCMRASGVPNYPDPGTGGTTNFNGTGVDPNSPFVQRATKVCGTEIDAPSWWISGAGPPGNVSVQSGPRPGSPGSPRAGVRAVPGTTG